MNAPFSGNQDMSPALEFHPIFPPAPRRVSFNNESLRNDFVQSFQKMQQAGEVDSLSAKYLGTQLAGQ